MKNFDLLLAVQVFAIALNIALMIYQGGIWTLAGLLIAGFSAWIALGDLEKRRLRKLEALDYMSRHGAEMEAAVSAMSSAGISAAEAMEIFSRNQPIGDVSCKNNAHSPYLRCAINPTGSCEGCKDYERS